MIIEQTKEQFEGAIRFHTHSEIASVRLSRAKLWSKERITRLGSLQVDFDVNFKPGRVMIDDRAVALETDFVFVIAGAEAEQSNDRSHIVIIECCFEVDYVLSPDYKPTEADVAAFRSANAVFNCWPFFREFIQNSITRMNYPPPTVPFLRIVRKPETPRQELPSAEIPTGQS